MSLSDRLQRARTERLIAAGMLPSEFALKPEKHEEPAVDLETEMRLFEPITIEVAPTTLHAVADAPADLGELPDGSSSCPNCNGYAHLDMVDLVGHTMHYTCEACGTMWQVRQPVDVPATPA